MPGSDEEILRDLLHRSTADLHAPSAITSGVVARHRRRRRARALGAVVTGAAAGTAIGLVASGSGGASTHPVTAASQIRLTAAQVTLYRLSTIAAGAPRPTGRYVVLRETQTYTGDGSDQTIARTSVIDGSTGDTWTYQQGPGVPAELPVSRHGSPTEAQFDAMPTTPAALRAALVTQYVQAQQAAQKAMEAQLRAQPDAKRAEAHGKARFTQLKLTGDDEVFEEATDMLWNPLVGPNLRSALFKVLATTPGVKVNTGAHDSKGRPAVEISRYSSVEKATLATYENPATTAVLETAYTYPGTGSGNGSFSNDLYLSITGTNTVPPNPYGG